MNHLREFFSEMGHPMYLVGLVGQAFFFSRFLIQWIASERSGKSTVPVVFWYLSIIGGLMVLIYAIWRRDPVITLGQGVGLLVYVRNLILIYRRRPARG